LLYAQAQPSNIKEQVGAKRPLALLYYLNKILSIGQTDSFFTAQVTILKINF
jgi:hypothetical protein